ncbi:MAG: hypothetical protein AAF334_11280, partial [Pseudomonadota bacterium]
MSKSSSLTERDKDLYTIIFCLLIICPYVFLFYAEGREAIQHNERMISRQMDRIKKRATAPDLTSESAVDLEQDLAAIKQRRDVLSTEIELMSARFASLQSVDDIKRLRLEITELAEWTGVSVKRFGELNEEEVADSIAFLQSSSENRYSRPVLTLIATADFGQLLDFIRGISDLSKNVAIVRFAVEAPDFDVDPQSDISTPELTATL